MCLHCHKVKTKLSSQCLCTRRSLPCLSWHVLHTRLPAAGKSGMLDLPRTRRLLPPLLPVVPPFRLVAASEAGVTRRTSALPARRYPLALSSFSTMLLQQGSTTASKGHTERSNQPLAASSSRAKMEPHRGASSQALTDDSDSAALSNLLKHGKIRAVNVRRMLYVAPG